MDKAGLQAGDVLEAVNGQPLTGMPDWFLARAHFERDRPIELQVRRGEQHVRLRVVITAPGFRTWNKAHYRGVFAFYLARFMLLLLAIVVAFSRPQQLNARLAAVMLAVGAVAEGYPSSGWAAALRHLPAVLAIPICLASVSCLLASMIWLPFCSSFPRPQLSQRWQWTLALVPIGFFGFPMVASAIAMIYAPSVFARRWPLVLSAVPVRVIQDIAGVAPLLFLNVWPFYRSNMHAGLLEIWLAVTVLYFAAGFLMLTANDRRQDDPQQRRRVGALCLAFVLFGFIVLHNVFTRNWAGSFAGAAPALFSGMTFAVEAVLFPLVPLTLAYCVLAEHPRGSAQQAGRTTANPIR